MRTGSESIEVIMRRKQVLIEGFVACMEDTRLPKCVMSRELVGARAAWGGRNKSGWGVSWMPSELSVFPMPSCLSLAFLFLCVFVCFVSVFFILFSSFLLQLNPWPFAQ